MRPKTSQYIECPRHKGRPRKHILVCRKCRYRAKCKAFQRRIQPCLPLTFKDDEPAG